MAQSKRVFVLVMILLILTNFVQSIRWLSITSSTNPGSDILDTSYADAPQENNAKKSNPCSKLTPQLIKGQLKFCKNHPEFMSSIRSGAVKAINECQFQFRSRRWNCSLPTTSKVIKGKRSYLTSGTDGQPPRKFQSSSSTTKIPIVPEGTRESAFLHAIASAAVAHSLTKQCSSGSSPNCGCDRSLNDHNQDYGFKWAGCSDNIDYGISLSRNFVDAKDTKLSRRRRNVTNNIGARAFMNLHNNEAGRQLILRSMKVDCKCHGVSGSCEIKTCWRSMPTFREIGEMLRSKFEGAVAVNEKRSTGSGSRRSLLVKADGNQPSDTDLVYIRNSPDFCEEDLKRGTLGTRGRRCSKNPLSHDSCNYLCCSRGFTTQSILTLTKCHCKFQWCCSVTCKECKKIIEISTCN